MIAENETSAPSSLMRWLKRLLPLAISMALVAWLVLHVSPEKLLAAAKQLAWQELAPATVFMALALFAWDAVCLHVLFGRPGEKLAYWQMLRLRGTSYLAGALNYELGQAVLAWSVARWQGTNVATALSRGVVLLLHDLAVLLGMGLLGSLFSRHAIAARVQGICLTGLSILAVLAAIAWLMPRDWKDRFRSTRYGAWLDTWSLWQSLRLLVCRIVYFSILVVYGAAALQIVGFHLEPAAVLGVIPLVMLADGLPSVSGLGTRETALLMLLQPPDEGPVLALSFVWSGLLIATRLAIGLVCFWGTKGGLFGNAWQSLNSRGGAVDRQIQNS